MLHSYCNLALKRARCFWWILWSCTSCALVFICIQPRTVGKQTVYKTSKPSGWFWTRVIRAHHSSLIKTGLWRWEQHLARGLRYKQKEEGRGDGAVGRENVLNAAVCSACKDHMIWYIRHSDESYVVREVACVVWVRTHNSGLWQDVEYSVADVIQGELSTQDHFELMGCCDDWYGCRLLGQLFT